MGTILCSVPNERSCVRAVLSGPCLKEPFPLLLSGFVSWKIRDSLSNVLFTYCFPPVALFIHSPRGNGRDTTEPERHGVGGGRRGEPCRGLWAARGASPAPSLPTPLGRSRPLRGARSLRGPVAFVAVSFRCVALKESLRRPRPAKAAPGRHPPPCTVAAFSSGFPGPGRAARLAPQAGHGRPARV